MSEPQEGVVEEIGCVVEVRPGRAAVRLTRSPECAGCHGCSLMDDGGMLTEAENSLGARAGDTVRIRTSGVEGKIKAALLLFGLPLAALLTGVILANRLLAGIALGAAAEGLSVLAGLLLMAACFGALHLWRKRRGKNTVASRIVEILERAAAG